MLKTTKVALQAAERTGQGVGFGGPLVCVKLGVGFGGPLIFVKLGVGFEGPPSSVLSWGSVHTHGQGLTLSFRR